MVTIGAVQTPFGICAGASFTNPRMPSNTLILTYACHGGQIGIILLLVLVAVASLLIVDLVMDEFKPIAPVIDDDH